MPARKSGPPARPELLALLQDAREHPDDVSRRLVLADWLEDHGGEADVARAELIRIQCELNSRHDPHVGDQCEPPHVDAHRAALLCRQDRLMARYAGNWIDPEIRRIAQEWSSDWGLLQLRVWASQLTKRRALKLVGTEAWAWVESINLTHHRFLSNNELLQSVTTVSIGGGVDVAQMRELVRSAWFPNLRRLTVHTGATWGAMTALAETPPEGLTQLQLNRSCTEARALPPLSKAPFRHLTTLDLRNNRRNEVSGAVADNTHLANLRHLFLSSNTIGPDLMRALANSPHLAGLVTLDLAYTDLGTEGAEALVGAPTLGNLSSLNLARNRLTETGAAVVLGSKHLRRLVRLDLSGNLITSVEAIVRADWPASLRELDLSENPITDPEMERLASCPQLAQLTTLAVTRLDFLPQVPIPSNAGALWNSLHPVNLANLDLSGFRLGPTGAAALGRARWVERLESLRLWGCGLGSEGVKALADSPLRRLVSLNLGGNDIGPDGVSSLARSRQLANLMYLNLTNNPLGDEGLLAILESPSLDQLTGLSLMGCDITDAGVQALAASPASARLTRLYLADVQISSEGANALIRSPHLGGLTRLRFRGSFERTTQRDLQRRFGDRLIS
jgi:uncharacterized protein (TIGR02996 family)